MQEKYKVLNIYEDDFGCEERSEDYVAQVIVILESSDGNELTIKQADAWMYEQDINEGDKVFLVAGKLQKEKLQQGKIQKTLEKDILHKERPEIHQTYQMIAFDMDGTLLDSEKKILPESKKAITKASQAEKIIILNTGRCLAELEEYLQVLPEVRYLNSVSGALVYDLWEDKVLFSKLLNENLVSQLLEYAALEKAMPQIMLKKSIIQKSHINKMEQFGMEVYQEMFERVSEKWGNITEEYKKNPFPAAKLNIFHTSAESRSRTEERIRKAGLEVTMVRAETTSLEISARGVDKGIGLEKLCEHLDIPFSQTIVVGDAHNDLEALKKAGLAIAMGNAEQSIKAVADAVVADCDHGGCAQAVEWYLLGEEY